MKTLKRLSLKVVWCLLCFSVLVLVMPSEIQANVDSLPINAYSKIYCEQEGKRIKLSEANEIEFLVAVKNEDEFIIDESAMSVFFSFSSTRSQMRVMSLNEEDSFKYQKETAKKEDGNSYEYLPLNAGEFVVTSHFYMSTAIDDPSGRFYDFLNPIEEDIYGNKAEILRFKVDFSESASRLRDDILFDDEIGDRLMVEVYTFGEPSPLDGKQYATGGSSDQIYFHIYDNYIGFSSESPDEARRIAYGNFRYFWNITLPARLEDLFDGCD